MAADTATIKVSRGSILCFRIFDIGDELRMDQVETCLASAPGRRRVHLTRDGAQCLQFAASPVDIEIGARKLDLLTRQGIDVALSARFFDYGAVSVEVEIPIAPGSPLVDLLPLCDELYESPRIEALAREVAGELVQRIHGAILGRHEFRDIETYTVIFVQALEGVSRTDQLVDSPIVAKLLLGEAGPKALGEEARRDVLKHAHSYFEDDLVVIDWNSAFVVEPSGSRDIPDILEFATSQLLELRYYDNLLDGELGKIYDEFALARRGWDATFRSPYARLARDVLRRLVELTEFTERVDNALKIIGDFYLARVYQSSVTRFRIADWRMSIDEKQGLVARSYDLLKGQVDIRRSTVLEFVVIALIALELVLALRAR